MSTLKRFLVILLLVILTNVGTYLFAQWQCREQIEGQEALLAQAAEQTREVQSRLDQADEELSRLRVWGDFIAIQQDLNRVNDQMNQLNFGNALDGVDAIIANLESGAYGSTFREHRSRLLPLLMDAKQALRNRSDRARGALVEFNEAAFTILSGLDPMASTPAPEPEPEPPATDEPDSEEDAATDTSEVPGETAPEAVTPNEENQP